MPIVLRARCHILEPNYRIVRAHLDVETPDHAPFGEYVLMNILRERGLMHDGKMYRIKIEPLFPHIE